MGVLDIETGVRTPLNDRPLMVVGYPRTGFSLLIRVIAEVANGRHRFPPRRALKAFCDTAGLHISRRIEQVFERRGLSGDLLYNGNFKQMVGGPKWLKEGDDRLACFRKYIGVRGKGDFTLFTSHPHQVLDYYEVIHSHVAPTRWLEHPAYARHGAYASIRHPAGTVASACFSLNALASEYIQRFLPPDKDNDLLRQELALYKLSDLNFFEALLTPFKAYLEEFSACADRYTVMRWEDLLQMPVATIRRIADTMGCAVSAEGAAAIWSSLDHVNLTGAHQHNLRRGHGIVGGWRLWVTNTHLDMMRDHGLDVLSKRYGYEWDTLDEAMYTPFQQRLAAAIARRDVIRDYADEDLFGFAFNKSNLDFTRFGFKQYPWRTHTRIERSSCTDEDLVLEVSDVAETACATINRALDSWFAAEAGDVAARRRAVEDMTPELEPFFEDAGMLSGWRDAMLRGIDQDAAEAAVSERHVAAGPLP